MVWLDVMQSPVRALPEAGKAEIADEEPALVFKASRRREHVRTFDIADLSFRHRLAARSISRSFC